jgi:hypothetical protein
LVPSSAPYTHTLFKEGEGGREEGRRGSLAEASKTSKLYAVNFKTGKQAKLWFDSV